MYVYEFLPSEIVSCQLCRILAAVMHVDRDPTDALMPDDALTALKFPRDCLEPSNVDRSPAGS